ncbi:MAG TPA: Gmad2 immunoglobulin-like domain-containing protein [Aggregatilineales bacterium]|nr:Gmad2 immunoglobulin-like domain-containing protein [Aggregatilineales bacterium]
MHQKTLWLFMTVVLALACNLTAKTTDETPIPTNTPPPPTDDGSPFISITEPARNGTAPVTVSPGGFRAAGQVRGSFENNVIVQALDENGEVLAENFTTATGGGFETIANWELDMQVFVVDAGTSGSLRAFFTSARDGSVVAEDTIPVTYGQP